MNKGDHIAGEDGLDTVAWLARYVDGPDVELLWEYDVSPPI